MSYAEAAIILACVALTIASCSAVFAIIAMRRSALTDKMGARRQAALSILRARDEWLKSEPFIPKM